MKHKKRQRRRSRLPQLTLIAFALFGYLVTQHKDWLRQDWLRAVEQPATMTATESAPQLVAAGDAVTKPSTPFTVQNPMAPLTVQRTRENGLPMTLIMGGVAGTRRAARRCPVCQFVAESGAQAGLNGTFFADARVAGTDSEMIGPTLCDGEPEVVTGVYDHTLSLTGRPLVLFSPTQTRIVPYQSATMDSEAGLQKLLPGVTDAFLGGLRLVHNGHAATEAQIAAVHLSNAEDYRRRAFFVLMPDGRPGIGATRDVTCSKKLALALQKAGVQEAVLLDSGFSTSLVDGKTILVTGHTAPGIPSRPVPHALVLFAVKGLAPKLSAAPSA